jgi:hypothetical protein
MKQLFIVVALAWSTLAIADHCGSPEAKHWSTVVKLKDTSVTLHWTGVYEAPPAVCRITYKKSTDKVRSLDVWGTPSVNEATGQIAFVSCRDDGCSSEILVADVNREAVLEAKLPLNDPQYYLKTTWKNGDNTLQIEVKSFRPGEQRYFEYYQCSVGQRMECKKTGI